MRCKHCLVAVEQQAEKAIGDGEVQMVWAAPDGEWICSATDEEHEAEPGDAMDEVGALDMAIFAINTLLHPDASTQEDVEKFDACAETVKDRLIEMRSELQ